MMRREEIGNCVLYHADCRDIFSSMTQIFDACITDPPYGICRDKGFKDGGKKSFGKKVNGVTRRNGYSSGWDAERPDASIFDFLAALLYFLNT